MPSLLRQTLRNRWFALSMHLGLWLLLYLAVIGLGGKTPDYHPSATYSPPPQVPVPIGKLETLFSFAQFPKGPAGTNLSNPFFTSYFVPPSLPAPTTRKIELTYQGFYQAGDGPKHAVVKVADLYVDAALGWTVASNVFVADATMQTLVLTNLSAQTNLLPLNVKKEIEVPAK
jgi:hypothetical protein